MNIAIHTIIILIAIIAGALSIYMANRMMRQYNCTYLASYFYYLVFIYIFGVYSIAGSATLEYLLKQYETVSAATIQTAAAFLLVIGTPFLILAWYMFLRLTHEFYRRQLPSWVGAAYFLFFLILFALYVFFNIYEDDNERIVFRFTRQLMFYIYTILSLVIYGVSIALVFHRSRSLKDYNQRKAFRWFAGWYAVIIPVHLVLLHQMHRHMFLSDLFMLSFSAFHILPVWFMYLYLQKHFVEHVEDTSFSSRLEMMADKYGITVREQEIITLICKGMTNQQITDSLFISLQTVKDHTHRIYLKTGVKNRVQLTNLMEKRSIEIV